jgi:rSAM/selenodomain-associated transferase 1
MTGHATIVVIAKAPVAGRVKTRLCPPCTPAQAAAIADAALRDTLEVVAATPATARVVALDGAPGPWIPEGFVIVPQVGLGLDERLANAFASVTGPALLIGMDTPQVTPDLLTHAIDTLHSPDVDAVLGLADDGGWWTIGLHRADPRVFVGVPMSTAQTGASQRARMTELGLRTTLQPRLRDVDSFPDALAVAASIPGSRFAAAVASFVDGDRVEDAG